MALKVNPANFVVAQNSAVVLHAGKSNERTLRGLQGMGLLLGFTMETQTVAEMGRRIALVVPSGGTYEPAEVNYNFIPGDPSFDEFRNAALNSTKLNDVRLYVKAGCDFSAADLISDAGSGLYVGSVSDPRTDNPNGLYTGSLSYMAGGAFVLFVAHKKGTALTYTAATRTLANSDADFVSACGFEDGDTLILDYADGNDPLYLQAESVTDGSIVLADGVGDIATLSSDFNGIATTHLHGATPMVVAGYSGLDTCD